MLKYMFMPFWRYFDFQGRSRRKEFWAFALLNFIVGTVFVTLALTMGLSLGMFIAMGKGDFPPMIGGFVLLFILGALYSLLVIIPYIAVTVRRLHDRGLSGWWYLGYIVLGFMPEENYWVVLQSLASVALFVLMLLPGNPGGNRYGPDPKDPHGADVFA